MRDLAQERVLTTGRATRLVDRMEAMGLVAREDNPEDRRGRLLRLTPPGEETAVRAARGVEVGRLRSSASGSTRPARARHTDWGRDRIGLG